ncbi:MAG: alanine racemase [Gammaproteobacteria bacterium]|nr:alanine racemase [Gammaproteobacteria bacterium]
MRRNARAIIDLEALIHNYQIVRQIAPDSKLMAVIKADAYGHGMVRAAKALSEVGVDGFAVACLVEAKALREAGIQQSITVFQGFQDAQQLQQMVLLNLRPVIHQRWQIEMLSQLKSNLSIWLKLNSGMGRLGLSVDEITQHWDVLQQNSHLTTIGLFSHFANADQPEHDFNQQQIALFKSLSQSLGVTETSMANSAGIMAFAESHGDWVRPGIMLYGSSPFIDKTAIELGLKPVMQLEAPLLAINQLKKGESIGYGSLWQCPEDMPVGVVGIGYGDGYPRHAGTGTPVWINGCNTQVIGRVSMDMISIDLRNIEQVKTGDSVVLWGHEVAVDEVAAHAQTIAYELLCHMGTSRID